MTDSPALELVAPRAVHLVGIGGSGISAIGLILAGMGHTVTGVDVRATPAWDPLQAAGIEPQVVAPDALFSSADATTATIVAHSTAFTPSAIDLDRARQAGRRIVDRASILGAICATRPTIAVSGTHGKTSTTAMLATVLDATDDDPSFLVGAVPVVLGEAARWGGKDGAFVVEADESDGSFLALGASTAVVTNIDEDHLDHWGSIEAIEAAFDRFVGAADHAVVCIDDPAGSGRADARAVRVAAAHDAVTVGEAAGARYAIHDVVVDRLVTTFGLSIDGTEVGPVVLAAPGRHHARNAAVAIAAAATRGIDPIAAVEGLRRYGGVARRFQVMGERRGVVVADDYAHNPGKVRALVTSTADAGWPRVVAVFQPHRFSRTRDQGRAQGEALAAAEVVAITDVYGAGEEPIAGVTSRIVADGLRAVHPHGTLSEVGSLDDALSWAMDTLRPGDICLTVGAGDISTLGPRILASLDEAGSTP